MYDSVIIPFYLFLKQFIYSRAIKSVKIYIKHFTYLFTRLRDKRKEWSKDIAL